MKTLFNLTTEIAESASVSSPKPPLYNVVFSVYEELGGSNNPKTIYDTLQAMLDEGLVSGGGGGSVFEGLANAGYSAAQISELETRYGSEVEIAVSKSLHHDSGRTDFSYYFSPAGNYYSTIIPAVDTSNGTNFRYMFFSNGCVYVPSLNTSKGTDFDSMFSGCSALETIPTIDTSNGTNFYNMFSSCRALETIPTIDTSNGTSFIYMFRYCTSLESLPKLNLSKAAGVSDMLGGCSALENVGGFTGLKHSIFLQDCSKLTLQSVINILTEAADLTGQTGATLTLHADAKARLTQAEYDLAASKNWTIA